MSNYTWGTHDYLNEDEREAEEERAYYSAADTIREEQETAPDHVSTTAQMSHDLLSGEEGAEPHEEVKLGEDAEQQYHHHNHTDGEHGHATDGNEAGVEALVNEIASTALNHAGGFLVAAGVERRLRIF